MQSTSFPDAPTARSLRSSHRFLEERSLRLEWDAPEEQLIHELEIKIGDARQRGEPLDELFEKRAQIRDGWLDRLEREIREAEKKGDTKTKKRLENQRERVVSEFCDGKRP